MVSKGTEGSLPVAAGVAAAMAIAANRSRYIMVLIFIMVLYGLWGVLHGFGDSHGMSVGVNTFCYQRTALNGGRNGH